MWGLAKKRSRPRSDTSHPKDEGGEYSLTDNTRALPASDTFPSQEHPDDDTPGPAGKLYHVPSSPGSTNENKELAITAIRATDVAHHLRGLPVTFYAVVHHSGLEWKTEKKRLSVNGDVEWICLILLPSDLSATVRFNVYTASEFQPTLGDEEQLRSVTTTLQQLLDRSAKGIAFEFFPKDGDVAPRCSSILVTVKWQKCQDDGSPAPRGLWPQWLRRQLLSTRSSSISLGPQLNSESGEEGATNQSHSAVERSDDKPSVKLDLARGSVSEDPQHLNTSLFELFKKRTGGLADRGDGISRHREAVTFTPHGHPNRPGRPDNLGVSYRIPLNCHRQPSDPEDAVSRQREAVELIPHGHPDKPGRLNDLGNSSRARFEHLGQISDLEDAVSWHREAVELTPRDHPDKPHLLNNLANSYQTRFRRFGQLHDLEDAISRLTDAVELTPHSHLDRPLYLNNLGNSYEIRFGRLGRINDFENAISRRREAVELTPPDHPNKPIYLNNLGTSYRTRFERLGQISDLEEAISRQTEAVELTPHGHPNKAGRLNNLGNSYQTRFGHLGQISDLEDAISWHREAVELTPCGHPDKPHRLNNLGNSCQTRFERLGQINDLEDAISTKKEANELTPRDHPIKPLYLNNLGISYQTRFERLGQISDLEDAIARQEEAIELTPHDHFNRPLYLNNLGISYRTRFQRLGQINDIEAAISRQREAVELTPRGHPDKPGRLNNLGASYKTRFERLGELSDLENAVSRLREATELTPHGHPNKPDRLNNLGNSYQIRFQRFGELRDLEDAISRQEEAVELTPHGHPNKPGCLNNLGNTYRIRFERLGQINDLDNAISRQREAVRLTPHDHADKPSRLNSLSATYQTRFQHLGELNDLEDAISGLREAIELTPHGHPEKPFRLNNLGISYRTRFQRLGQLRDLEDAISRQMEAVELTPHGHLNKPGCLHNLGNSYQTRFERLGQISDIENAILRKREAVGLTPHGHPDRPGYLYSLGNSYRTRFKRRGEPCDLRHAISIFSHAASIPIGPINVRFSATTAWISCARLIHHHSLLHAYSITVSLIPQLAWIGHSLSRRFDELMKATDIVREAAAAALEEGFPERAVEWLEQGRSIIWGELFQLRSSYEGLSSAHPDYARRLRELSTQLDQASATHEQLLSVFSEQNPGVSHHLPESLQQVTDRHRAFAIERDKLLQKIRRLPGFERFLLHKEFSQLRASTHSGPVVILNVAETRCDALALVTGLDHVIHVPLPNFTAKGSIHLQNTMKYFVRCIRDGKIAPLHGISWESVLPPLWKTVVKPVLDALAFSVVREDLSRIFWCPTGPLAFLPIHAAGLYNRQYSTPGNKVFDFVVSSYVPTLAILAPSLNPDPTVAASNDLLMLTVGQPSSDGQSPLPGVAAELVHIKDAIENSPSAQTVLVESSVGTVEEVLALMKETDWVHFACHGIQDGVNSGLCLADRRRLKLRDMVRLSRPRGGLAFLSACQTATGEKKLSDEAIHMAAGMLFAGYGGVIGTMWSISDNIAPRVARDVYGQLLKKGKRPDYREAARALQDAIEGLRNTEVPFTEWIPFIHVGL